MVRFDQVTRVPTFTVTVAGTNRYVVPLGLIVMDLCFGRDRETGVGRKGAVAVGLGGEVAAGVAVGIAVAAGVPLSAACTTTVPIMSGWKEQW